MSRKNVEYQLSMFFEQGERDSLVLFRHGCVVHHVGEHYCSESALALRQLNPMCLDHFRLKSFVTLKSTGLGFEPLVPEVVSIENGERKPNRNCSVMRMQELAKVARIRVFSR